MPSTQSQDNQRAETVDISIVICTRNRAESLRELLTHLSNDDRDGMSVEIIIVDNNGSDNTCEIAGAFSDAFRIRYFQERNEGKCHALNRALDEGINGSIVAFIDDDLTPEKGWFKGVKGSCERWPDHDIFGGRAYAILPQNLSIPAWASDRKLHGWVFSVTDHGTSDYEIPLGHHPIGGHFWLKSRALASGMRFPNLWLTEPGFIFGLQNDGYKGVLAGDVLVGHRIQPHLLKEEIILGRMAQLGHDVPYVRMPNLRVFKHARLFHDHTYFMVLLCLANTFRWLLEYGYTRLMLDRNARFAAQVFILNALSNNWETVYHCYHIKRFCRATWEARAAR